MDKPLPIDLLIKDVSVLPMDDADSFLKHTDIAVDKGRILEIGQNLSYQAREVITLKLGVAMPGLINCHMHATLTRGVCEDLKLMDWLSDICHPLDAAYTPEIMEVSERLNQLEMILSGTTTFVDIYRFMHESAKVLEESGLRGFLTPQVIENQDGVGESMQDNIRLFHDWHGKANGRIHVWMGIHAPYSVEPEAYLRAKEFADKHGIGIHTHLCETMDEVNGYLQKYGKTPVRMLEDLGAFGGKFIAAHCVHVSDEDIDILARRGVTAIYNPISNMKLASGIAPVVRMRERGVNVVLATDSNLSNNNIDLLKEMQIAAPLQKLGCKDATVLKSRQVLKMTTRLPAKALGLEEEVGELAPGKKADIILLDFDRPHLWPYLDGPGRNTVVDQIVYSANGGDVDTTIVDGKVLMKHRQVRTLDREKIYFESQKMMHKLCITAGLLSDF